MYLGQKLQKEQLEVDPYEIDFEFRSILESELQPLIEKTSIDDNTIYEVSFIVNKLLKLKEVWKSIEEE